MGVKGLFKRIAPTTKPLTRVELHQKYGNAEAMALVRETFPAAAEEARERVLSLIDGYTGSLFIIDMGALYYFLKDQAPEFKEDAGDDCSQLADVACNFAQDLKGVGIQLLVVDDGILDPAKINETLRRRSEKEAQSLLLRVFGYSHNWDGSGGRTFQVSRPFGVNKLVQRALAPLGVEFTRADGEADVLIAALARERGAAAILSRDTDFLIFDTSARVKAPVQPAPTPVVQPTPAPGEEGVAADPAALEASANSQPTPEAVVVAAPAPPTRPAIPIPADVGRVISPSADVIFLPTTKNPDYEFCRREAVATVLELTEDELIPWAVWAGNDYTDGKFSSSTLKPHQKTADKFREFMGAQGSLAEEFARECGRYRQVSSSWLQPKGKIAFDRRGKSFTCAVPDSVLTQFRSCAFSSDVLTMICTQQYLTRMMSFGWPYYPEAGALTLGLRGRLYSFLLGPTKQIAEYGVVDRANINAGPRVVVAQKTPFASQLETCWAGQGAKVDEQRGRGFFLQIVGELKEGEEAAGALTKLPTLWLPLVVALRICLRQDLPFFTRETALEFVRLSAVEQPLEPELEEPAADAPAGAAAEPETKDAGVKRASDADEGDEGEKKEKSEEAPKLPNIKRNFGHLSHDDWRAAVYTFWSAFSDVEDAFDAAGLRPYVPTSPADEGSGSADLLALLLASLHVAERKESKKERLPSIAREQAAEVFARQKYRDRIPTMMCSKGPNCKFKSQKLCRRVHLDRPDDVPKDGKEYTGVRPFRIYNLDRIFTADQWETNKAADAKKREENKAKAEEEEKLAAKRAKEEAVKQKSEAKEKRLEQERLDREEAERKEKESAAMKATIAAKKAAKKEAAKAKEEESAAGGDDSWIDAPDKKKAPKKKKKGGS